MVRTGSIAFRNAYFHTMLRHGMPSARVTCTCGLDSTSSVLVRVTLASGATAAKARTVTGSSRCPAASANATPSRPRRLSMSNNPVITRGGVIRGLRRPMGAGRRCHL